MKGLFIGLLASCVILIIAVVVKGDILGQANYVRPVANPLASATSKALITKSNPNYQPIFGDDFTINSIKYFYNNSWVVVGFQPTNAQSDAGLIIFKIIGGNYKRIAGPDSTFNTTILAGVPSQVGQYVTGK